MLRIETKDSLIDYFCTKALTILFPLLFADFVLYLTTTATNDNDISNIQRLCNFTLGKKDT